VAHANCFSFYIDRESDVHTEDENSLCRASSLGFEPPRALSLLLALCGKLKSAKAETVTSSQFPFVSLNRV
jgi:hypothetical protein